MAARRADRVDGLVQADCRQLIDSFLTGFQGPLLTLAYEESIADPRSTTAALAGFAGVAANAAAQEFITPDLARFTTTTTTVAG